MDSPAAPLASESKEGETDLPKARAGWKQTLLALFATWHLVAVIVYVLPYPMFFDKVSLERPESKEELHRLFSTLKPLAPWWKTEEELQSHVLGWVQSYIDGYFQARKVFEPYLDITGSTQAWNMFAGTPPRYPMVFMVEVFPKGQTNWVPYKDFNWGTPDFHAIHFRHFEVQGNLSGPGWDAQRSWYASYWARRWNHENPTRPAQYVRFYYLRLTTPSAAQVRAGNADRNPQRVQEWYWSVPSEGIR